ncbi:MAG TPA: YceI family protein [Steroidobacteraceae bacterium]|nr:YceI family protein [Steroidobacteraceae bacterium]
MQGDISGATVYKIDGAASDVHILVYKGGAMARLGHNHVLSSKEVHGALYLQSNLSNSMFELTLPVASLQVDDPAARAREGEDFAAEVPQDARDGTRRNLIRPDVLDLEHYPTISLRSMSVSGTRAAPTLTVRVSLKGTARDVIVPTKMVEAGKQLTVTGEFKIKQTEFGMTPFSVALGALQVLDELRVKFSIVCRQQ